MKTGKPNIHNLPVNDITNLSVLAQQMVQEAQARGETLPPAARLHIGEPSFRTPEHIRQAAMESIAREPLTYAPAIGWPWLRELLAEKIARVNGYRVGPENVAIGMGGTGVIQATFTATLGPGDEALIPDPHWPHYSMQLAACGATRVPYALNAEQAWLPDIAQLEQLVTPRTKLLVINSPGNPTGAVFPASLMADLLDFARRHDLYLLSDECYDEIVFEGQHVSPATFLTRDEFNEGRVICIYTFSKSYAMTGWRIGYVATGAELLKTIVFVLDSATTNISTAVQRAAAAAMSGPQDCIAEMRNAYHHRRDLAVGLLKEHGRYVYTPHGAFYILVDITNPRYPDRHARQFSLDLLYEKNITVGPGSAFGPAADHYVRVSLSASDEEIARGVREVCLFADR
jgi:aspartate aminotransferase